jgi:ABC-type bacteriocin/lantibiotic exporter with double-glycine peptidase domain
VTSHKEQRLRDLIPFARAYIEGDRWKLAGVIVLETFLKSITGIGLLLILPLLGLLGVGSEASESPLWRGLQLAVANLGLTLSLDVGLAFFVAVVVIRATLEWRRSTWQVDVEQQFQLSLRTRLYTALARSEFYRLQQLRSSQFIQSTQVEIRQAQMAVNVIFRLFSQCLNLLVHFTVAMILSLEMTLFAVTCGILSAFLLVPLVNKIHKLSSSQVRIRAKMLTNLIEHTQGARSARLLGLIDRFAADFRHQCLAAAEGNSKISRLTATSSLIFQIIAVVLLAAFVYVGLSYYQVDSSVFIVLLIIFIRIFPAVGVLQTQIQQFVQYIPSFRHYLDLVTDLEAHAEAESLPEEVPRLSMYQSLKLRDVGFSYLSANGPALNDITLTLEKGSFSAICGQSGVGKSTLADIIIGLLPAQQGSVLIDDVPLDQAGRLRWREEVCLVPQESFLFDDSVRGNLLCVKPDVSDQEIWNVLEIVNSREFVKAREGKLDSMVGERGNQLSGGERQRLSIARALLRQPQLLVLDEPTNNLDEESVLALLDVLPRVRAATTLLLISHDPRILALADKVFELKDGILTQSTFEPVCSIENRLAHSEEPV